MLEQTQACQRSCSLTSNLLHIFEGGWKRTVRERRLKKERKGKIYGACCKKDTHTVPLFLQLFKFGSRNSNISVFSCFHHLDVGYLGVWYSDPCCNCLINKLCTGRNENIFLIPATVTICIPDQSGIQMIDLCLVVKMSSIPMVRQVT